MGISVLPTSSIIGPSSSIPTKPLSSSMGCSMWLATVLTSWMRRILPTSSAIILVRLHHQDIFNDSRVSARAQEAGIFCLLRKLNHRTNGHHFPPPPFFFSTLPLITNLHTLFYTLN